MVTAEDRTGFPAPGRMPKALVSGQEIMPVAGLAQSLSYSCCSEVETKVPAAENAHKSTCITSVLCGTLPKSSVRQHKNPPFTRDCERDRLLPAGVHNFRVVGVSSDPHASDAFNSSNTRLCYTGLSWGRAQWFALPASEVVNKWVAGVGARHE